MNIRTQLEIAGLKAQIEFWNNLAFKANKSNDLVKRGAYEEEAAIIRGEIKDLETGANFQGNLEWFEGGDGVTYEMWQDSKTEEIFRVPIEVVRDFKNKD